MPISRKFWKVYAKSAWAAPWAEYKYLEILTFSAAKHPAVGQAGFAYKYGRGAEEDGVASVEGDHIKDFSGWYFLITQSDNVNGLNETIKFVGHVPEQEFVPEGESEITGAKTAEQVITAYAIDHLLGLSKMSGAWVTDDGAAAKKIDIEIPFNNRLHNGRIEGNRSETIFYSAQSAFIFDARKEGRKVWSVWRILDTLMKLHKPATGPSFAFPSSYSYADGSRPAEIEALDLMQTVYDYHNKNLRDALNELVGPNRGMNWGIRLNGETAEIHIWSVLETAVTVGAITIPAHDINDRQDVSLWNNANDNIAIKRTDSDYDRVVVLGAPIKVCGTFTVANGEIEKGWTATKETAYKDAAKLSTGYAALSDDEKALLNDVFRTAEKFEEVFTAFVVPAAWDWKLGAANVILNPKFDPATCDFVSGQQGIYWNGQKRFIAYLPLKEGWDYSGATPVDLSPAGAEDKYRKIMAIATHANGSYVNLEKCPSVTAQVMPMTERFGAAIRFNPSHVLAKNHWTGAEPSEWDDSLDEFRFDWSTLQITAMLETDQNLAAETVIRQSENPRELRIEMPNAELWTILPDTVIDVVDKDGKPGLMKYPAAASVILRDDRDIIQSVLAAAAAFYSRPRYKISLVSIDFEWDIAIGKMLTGFNIEGDSSRGGCISSIVWNPSEGTIAIQTDSAELDFGLLAGAATAMAISGKHTATRRGGTEIEKVKKTVQQLREEIYTAVKQRPSAMGGGGGATEALLAYCNQDAPDSDTITCWLGYPEINVRVWQSATPFDSGQIATYANKFWLSKENANHGNTPAENTHWTEITAYNEATTYNITTAIYALYDNKLWRSLQAGNVGHIPTEGARWTTKAPAWSSGISYIIGGRATHSGKLWRSLTGTVAAPNVGNTPVAGSAYWAEIPEIEVHCDIAGGTSLQFAFPLLAEQQRIVVKYNTDNARYEATTLFQACEVTCAAGGMLELVNEMLVTDIPSSSTDWVDAQVTGVGILFPAYANSTYVIEFSLIYTSAARATGIVLGVSGPAGKISVSGVFFGHESQSTPGAMVGKAFNDYHNVDECAFGNSDTGVNFIRGECVLQTGATPGPFYLRFHSENTEEIVLKIGSNIKYRRIYREE